MKRVILALTATALLAASAAVADVCPPAKVADLAVPLAGFHSVLLTWTDPGDDCSTGTANGYEIRFSLSPISESNYYNAAVLVSGGPAGAGGTSDCAAPYTTSLGCSTTYYFAITFTDAAGNRSPVSNSPSGTVASCSSHIITECP